MANVKSIYRWRHCREFESEVLVAGETSDRVVCSMYSSVFRCVLKMVMFL